MLVHPSVAGQFRMKRGHQMPALLHQHRVAVVPCQHLGAGPHAANDRRADEHCLQIAALQLGRNRGDAAVQLPCRRRCAPRRYPSTQATPATGLVPAGQQNRAGAGAEHRLASRRTARSGSISPGVMEQLEHGGALAARNASGRPPVPAPPACAPRRLRRRRVRAPSRALRNRPAARGRRPVSICTYQPRVCISSPSASLEMSRPGIAMPRSSLASSSFSGSL